MAPIRVNILIRSKFTSEEQRFRNWCRYTPGSSGRWENLQLVCNPNEADIFVVINGKHPRAHKHNTIYLQREPHALINSIRRRYNLMITYKSYYHAAMWWVSQSYDELMALRCPPKPKVVSSVMTGKSAGEGRKRRLKFLVGLTRVTDVDVFGHYAPNRPPKHFRAMGWVKEKERGLLDYRFSVAMEHMSVPGYFSEKFIDPLLCWCKPIYFGPPDIDSYFPKGSYIWIDPSNPTAVEDALRAMEEPIDYDAITEARHLILNEYNVMPTLHRFISSHPTPG